MIPTAPLSSSAPPSHSLTGAQARALDRICTEQLALPVDWLMEAAGWQIARRCRGRGLVSVVCGTGGNAGDGLAAARHLSDWGLLAAVSCIDVEHLGGPARAQAEALLARGVQVMASPNLERADLVVDALLGSGLSRPPAGPIAEAIRALREGSTPVLSVDLPSGLDSDTGQAPGEVVQAQTTVALGLPKTGLLQARGPDLAGEVWVADIGIPAAAYAALGVSPPLPLFADSDCVLMPGRGR